MAEPQAIQIMNQLRNQQQRLDESGYSARCAVELEFTHMDEAGNAAPLTSQQKHEVAQALISAFPEIGYFYEESSHGEACGTMFEIVIGPGVQNLDATLLSPTQAVDSAYRIEKAIKQESERFGLNTARFDARPYANGNTNAKQINISLWDSDNLPAFTDANLLAHCQTGLQKVQRESVLLHAPQESSYERYSLNAQAPSHIGLTIRRNGAYAENAGGSYAVKSNAKHKEKALSAPEFTRIENRLAGADADIGLVMLATLGGMVEGVRAGAKNQHPPEPSIMPLSHSLEESVAQFSASPDMKELLGPSLRDGVLAQYDPALALSRRR